MRPTTTTRALACLSFAALLLLVAVSVGRPEGAALAQTNAVSVAEDAAAAQIAATGAYTAYLPFVTTSSWEPAQLLNGGFEGGAWRQTLTGEVYGEISVPESWTAFWDHGDYPLGRPEMKIIPNADPYLHPPRVYAGAQALQWFHFYHTGDAGVLQQVAATPGAQYRAEGHAHAWYSTGDNPYVSEWNNGDTWYTIEDGDPGMEVLLGIDPYGGLDPWSGDVVWSRANIYDQFEKLSVEATAQATTVTVFVRAVVLYQFKHADAYWDEVTLQVVQ